MRRSDVLWSVGLLVMAVAGFATVYVGAVPVAAALIIGGSAEALGFGMTFWDLVETERRVRRFLNSRYGSFHLELGPAVLTATGVLTPTVKSSAPTVEDRVARLEAAQAVVDSRIQEAVRAALQEARDAAAKEAERVRQDATEADRRLTELISGITLAGMRLRRVGVVFFVIGLALATAANLVAS